MKYIIADSEYSYIKDEPVDDRVLMAQRVRFNQNVIDQLADDRDYKVIAALIENPHISEELKEILSNKLRIIGPSSSKLGKIEVAKTATSDLLFMLLVDDYNFAVRKTLASNPNLSYTAFSKLSTDSEWIVRETLAKNRNIPEDILKTLMQDDKKEVRRVAEARYMK